MRAGRIVVAGLLLGGLLAGGLIAALVTAAAPGPSATSASELTGWLSGPTGPYLTDEHGRVVFLRGVNAVYKYAPFELYPASGQPYNLSAKDAAEMSRLGFNVVRLGIIWQGLEPGTAGPNDPAICDRGPAVDPRQFNAAIADAYLDRVAKTVAVLARYHIYTLLDMHEDIYSSVFGGEGAPPWAVCTNGLPIRHLPGRWSNTYADPALDAATVNFWTNDVRGDLQGQLDRVWKLVAEKFKDDSWVVGYDLINEPFSRSVIKVNEREVARRLECFYTGRARPGRDALDGSLLRCPHRDPLEGVIPTIRSVDPRHLIFFEPDIFSSHNLPNDLGPMNYHGLVFNFHVYCGYRSPVTGDPTNLTACVDQELRTMQRRRAERPGLATPAQPAGPPWFMSEFGATQSVPLLLRLTDLGDEMQLGWTYWAWQYYDDPTGSAHEALVGPTGALEATALVLSRAYPQAVAGIPLSFDYSPTTATFHLVYEADPAISSPTVVYVPVGVHYPRGYCATAAGATIVSAPNATHLLVTGGHGVVAVTVKQSGCQNLDG
ncbi:MAG TPA: cellulase family glycosylhydrolase [Acidimicrobiales bacterium]|nr:cellulase family glycosylhydrolase [Acidimicrobiales bacterium]